MDQHAAAPPPMRLSDGLDLLAKMRDQLRGATSDNHAFVRFCINNLGWSFGQHLQDLWVAYETRMKRGGFFVEFGAIDGIEASNSYALEQQLGWHGIVAEPARRWHEAIARNRTCAIDQRCVWMRTGETVRFNQTPLWALSTIDEYSGRDGRGDKRAAGERYDVETVSLTDLLDHWRAPRRIDYLSIDTEGSEYDILRSFDWDRYEIGLITVELFNADTRRAIHDLLTAKGYRLKFREYSHADGWYVRGD